MNDTFVHKNAEDHCLLSILKGKCTILLAWKKIFATASFPLKIVPIFIHSCILLLKKTIFTHKKDKCLVISQVTQSHCQQTNLILVLEICLFSAARLITLTKSVSSEKHGKGKEMGPGHQDLGSNSSYAAAIKVAVYKTPFSPSSRLVGLNLGYMLRTTPLPLELGVAM